MIIKEKNHIINAQKTKLHKRLQISKYIFLLVCHTILTKLSTISKEKISDLDIYIH